MPSAKSRSTPKAKPPAALLLALALAKNLGDPDPLPAGEYRVCGEVLFSVDAIVTQGEPTTAKATVRVDAGKLIAAYLHVAGVKMPPPERLHELVSEAFNLAASVSPPDEPYRSRVALVEDTLNRCKEEAAQLLPRVERSGICRAPGKVELIGWAPRGD
jgi:hypothetical protein